MNNEPMDLKRKADIVVHMLSLMQRKLISVAFHSTLLILE